MTKKSVANGFIDIINSLDHEFLTPDNLVAIGLYRNKDEVRRALIRKDFACIRVTRNRTLIPKDEIIKFLLNASKNYKYI
jgi:hypothetical protein